MRAGIGPGALEKVRELRPDLVLLVLLDVNMPGVSGLKTAGLMRAELPEMRILMMSLHDAR